MKNPCSTFPFIKKDRRFVVLENDAIPKVFLACLNFGLGSQKVDECIKYQPLKRDEMYNIPRR